jgi:hypothetical protein
MKRTRGMTRRRLTAMAMAVASLLIAGCSAGTYPAVLADPAPRQESTMTPDEVKQATDSLLSDRNHLCSVAIANAAPGSPPPDCAAQTAAH